MKQEEEQGEQCDLPDEPAESGHFDTEAKGLKLYGIEMSSAQISP